MYDLVIIGAGPAGIAVAAEAIKSGISQDKILILEKSSEHSASIRRFYPEKKLVTANYKGNESSCLGTLCIEDSSKQETLNYLDEVIEKNGLCIKFNEEIYGIEKLPDGVFIIKSSNGHYHTKTCTIAIGILGRPNRPSYKIPPSLRDKISFDITSTPIKNKKVLVVGGGDSASEYCQNLVEAGNDVSLSYRKESFARMNKLNLQIIQDLEHAGKVKIIYNSNIEKIVDMEGPFVIFCESFIPGQKYDHIVLALGGSTPKNFLKLLGIEFNGNLPVIKKGHETNVPGLFLVGDLASGKAGGSIISAFNTAHQAMKHIYDQYLDTPLSP
ncbi:MAG: cbb3-type cytochrome oxidase assembly protein CcoS [Epsilonproteobacteria bacterium]|nr:MAG: cbb3-type cytochrome oxidase assembly protein CcoS [Campylobacterota bacterium]RLA65913.1 MAG: cbb3-type cytochrome oxidase assembly protein CcoS [Campylobacterota bacterium]